MSLEASVVAIKKRFGDGAIMQLGKHEVVPVEVISTGCMSLDRALRVGGFPRGRVIEIFGPESGGKTTLSLQHIACAQSKGGTCAIIDAEHALDLGYAQILGVKVEDLLVSQPSCGEEALEIVEELIKSNEIDIVVVDSVAALVPKAELDGEAGDSHMGLQARLMSQALRRLTGAVSKSNTILVFINQLRDKLGVTYGSHETTTGGRALKFYASVRIDIRRKESIKDGETVVGARTKAKVVKNKVGTPFGEAEFDLLYGKGISRESELIDLGVAAKVIDRSGSWFSYGGERLSQGKANAIAYLEQDHDLANKIEAQIRDSWAIKGAV